MNSLVQLYLNFFASLHHFYARRDSQPWVFVLASSTLLMTFTIIGVYDGLQFYFFDAIRLRNHLGFVLFGVIGLLNYYFVVREQKYRDLRPSRRFYKGVILYIVLLVFFVAFIANKYRSLLSVPEV